jgi:hypothetical protein
MEEQNKKIKKTIKKKVLVPIFAIVAVGLVFVILSTSHAFSEQKNKEEIVTTSKLEKVINISELSSFQAVYNGVAEVMNEEEADDLDFYVSYEAKILAGIDFEKVKIIKDEESKKIIVNVPKIEITDVIVDINSLDFMFYNDKSNKSAVLNRAYSACIEDATKEVKKETMIDELATKNAKNIIEALLEPFIQQFGPEYELEIN